MLAFFAKRYNEALELLIQAAEESPKDPTIRFRLGLISAVGTLEYAAALHYFKECIELNPEYLDAHIFLGLIYSVRFGCHDKARAHFELVLKLENSYCECHFFYGTLLFLHFQEYDLAQKHLLLSFSLPIFQSDLSHDLFALFYRNVFNSSDIDSIIVRRMYLKMNPISYSTILRKCDDMSTTLGKHKDAIEILNELLSKHKDHLKEDQVKEAEELRNLAIDRLKFILRFEKFPMEAYPYVKIAKKYYVSGSSSRPFGHLKDLGMINNVYRHSIIKIRAVRERLQKLKCKKDALLK